MPEHAARPAMPRPISFLSDYGHSDEFVGVCHGVIAESLPMRVSSTSPTGSSVMPFARARSCSPTRCPSCRPECTSRSSTPGVGSARRPVALRLGDGDRILVGPDNGLLSLACAQLGGVKEAVELTTSPMRLEPVTATFHGRDLFAPVAAHLAVGAPARGRRADRSSLADPDRAPRAPHLPGSDRRPRSLCGRVREPGAEPHARAARVHVSAPGEPGCVAASRSSVTVTFGTTFADVGVGQGIMYEDSSRSLALAVNRESAAELLELAPDDEVVLSPAH